MQHKSEQFDFLFAIGIKQIRIRCPRVYPLLNFILIVVPWLKRFWKIPISDIWW